MSGESAVGIILVAAVSVVAVQYVTAEDDPEVRGDTLTENAGEPLVRLIGGVTTVHATVVARPADETSSCSELPRLDSEDFIHSFDVAGETGVKALGMEREGRVNRRSRGESGFLSKGALVDVVGRVCTTRPTEDMAEAR